MTDGEHWRTLYAKALPFQRRGLFPFAHSQIVQGVTLSLSCDPRFEPLISQ
jgi:hypothetical protein